MNLLLGLTKMLCMKLNEWLAAEIGRTKALADHFGLTPSAVSQWKDNGIPPRRMLAIRDFTDGAVSVEEMLPATTEQA